MRTWRHELRAYDGEPRASTGWRLTKVGWRLLRRDRALAALAVLVAAVLGLVVATPLLGRALGLWDASGDRVLVRVASTVLATGLLAFLLVAFAGAVDAAVDGMPLDLREAFAEARERLGTVVAWTAIWLALWLGIVLATDAAGAPWLQAIAAPVWYAATLFVIPGIAVERLGAPPALAGSVRLFAANWRAGCAGLLGIAALTLAALMVPGAMLAHASALHAEGSASGALAFGGLLVAVVIAALALTTREAFAVLQLREALDDLPPGEYAGRRLRRRAKVGRIAGGLVAFIVVLVAMSALTRGDWETLEASSEPGANYAVLAENPDGIDLPSGAPVIYRSTKVGVVLGSHEEGGRLSVRFHVEPGIGPESAPGRFRVVDTGALGPALVLIPAPGASGGGEAQPF